MLISPMLLGAFSTGEARTGQSRHGLSLSRETRTS